MHFGCNTQKHHQQIQHRHRGLTHKDQPITSDKNHHHTMSTTKTDAAKEATETGVQQQESEDDFKGYASFSPPDGGFGWCVVLAAFSVQFFVLGTMNNFGILFTKLLEEFGESKQATSWVGSITYGLMFGTGPIATSVSERIGCRPVAIIGALVGMVGTLLASFSDSIFKMYLTEGFLFGVGASLCYFPSVIILPQYFYKNLSMANGLVACGSGVGTMAMGPVINYVIENYGWRTSCRMTTGLFLICALISLTYRPNEVLQRMLKNARKDQRQPLLDTTVFQNKGFLAFTAALFIFMLAYFVPFVHLTQMALEYDIPMSKASLLIGFMSVASTFGRLFFGKIADFKCINRLYMYQIGLLGIGVANTICPLLKSFPGLLVYCTIFGFFEGCYVCQVAVITGDIVGIDRMAVAVGILFGIKSIPLTLGPPLAGFLYDISKSYQVAFYVAGAIPTVASIMMFAVPFLIPPQDHPFWKKYGPSRQYLINSDSSDDSCIVENNNNEKRQCDKKKYELDSDATSVGHSMDSLDKAGHPTPQKTVANRFLLQTKNDKSFTSIGSFNHLAPFENGRLSMRQMGSISSFGSVIFSPVSPMAGARSSTYVVVDRVTNV